MTKKNIFMIVAALVLGVVYVIYFSDWFKPRTVQIFHTSRELRRRAVRPGAAPALPSLIFGINQSLQLVEVKVVPAEAFKTNQNATTLWHLVSDSNSVPVKEFLYGQMIRGMKPAIKGVRPLMLETNVTYHLIVLAADGARGEHDFDVK